MFSAHRGTPPSARAARPLLLDPVDLIEYVSTVVRLNPGAPGAPGGVGHARRPERYLLGGETVVAEIDGIGRLENRVVKENAS